MAVRMNKMIKLFVTMMMFVGYSTGIPRKPQHLTGIPQRGHPVNPVWKEKQKYMRDPTRSKYTIMVGCDGMGQLYIENYTHNLPWMSYLIKNGAVHNRTRTRMPSVSAPNWATIITGMEPEKSGVYSNDWVPSWSDPANFSVMEMPPATGRGRIPTPIWSIIKEQTRGHDSFWGPSGMSTAVFHSWPWIEYLVNDDVDYHLNGNENDTMIMNKAIDHVMHNMTNFMFLHFDQVDEAGHGSYWGSPKYYNAIRNIDSFLGNLIQALQIKNYWKDTTIFVTADHGGWGGTHGFFNQACMYVPNIWCSGKAKQGFNSDRYTTNIDFVPSVLHSLGLLPSSFTHGRVMWEMFDFLE